MCVCVCLASPQAVEFLSRVERLSTHAVHFAIALQDMELLNLTDSPQAKLCKHHYITMMSLSHTV